MSEAWDDERFEHDEFRKMFQMMLSDPEMLAAMQQMGARAHAQALAHNLRREVFTRLVLVLAQACEKPVPQDKALAWALAVINNSYAVPLPDEDGKISELAVAFVLWYQGRLTQPAWVPAGFAFDDPLALPVAPFPLPPTQGDA